MFATLRSSVARTSARSFSTSRAARSDISKLTLVGRLGKDPELRTSKLGKDYVTYVVATSNYPPPPPNPDGSRPDSTTTWHRIMSFHEGANKYLMMLRKGSKVYVEANFELREPEPNTDPSTPAGQRQIFLRHEMIRMLSAPKAVENHEEMH
ncbi:single-strand binding protein family-domain-containing protein [Pterulicium gracile]|uniref:Single-strand binding protein family-domain-containing protein n=1 Tax=Pterulicium gracile TaxID=1884261 RepID=A0A5C3QU52_9AGAR|nr:single-strand binding protein family-domain-containing protein [Pterula gracilis]